MRLNSVSKSNLDPKPSFIKEFAYGVMLPFRAADLIFSHSKLLSLSILPIVMTTVTLATSIYFGIHHLHSWVDGLILRWTQNGHGFLSALAAFVISIGVIYFAIQSAAMIASLISSPFNDFLAEKTEHTLKVQDIPKRSLGYTLKVFLVDIRKTTFTLGMVIVFSVGLLLPGVNVASFLALALLNTFTFITYPQSRRAHGLMESWQWIRQHLGAAFGFGIVMSLVLSTPIINFFAIPVAVVGGTMLYFKK